MKVLFQPVYLETPHFETELELMADHLEAGDEVYVLVCEGELETCFANYSHEPSLCAQCRRRSATGLSLLGPGVKVLHYPFESASVDFRIPETVSDFEALKAVQVGRAQIGLAAAASLCTRFTTHRFDPACHPREVATELRTALYVYQAAKRVLLEVRPDRVYLFNGRLSTALPALNACEELGVAYLTHDRGGTRDRYHVVPNTLPHDLDRAHREIQALWLSHSEAESSRRGARFFVDRRNRIEQSWFVYTSGQQVGKLPEGFDRGKRNVGIFNSSLEESAAVRCWPDTLHVYESEIDAVCRICEAFAGDPSVHIYLRVHPNLEGLDNTQTRDLRFLDGRFQNLTVVSAGSLVDTYALMDECAPIVTFGSTVGVEACFWRKPSILLGRAFYEDLDCVHKPETHEAVISLLRDDVPAKPTIGALKYGLWDLERGTPFTRYRAESLRSGTFNGVNISSGPVHDS